MIHSSRLLPFLMLILTGCALRSGPPASLPALMVQRLEWMDQVAEAKQARGLPVNDPKREAELLAAMEKLGAESGLPKEPVRRFFIGQMQAAKARQEEWLKAHPPANQQGKAIPDLAKTIRPALDQIGKLMLAGLAQARAGKDVPAIIGEARRQLVKAGCSRTVIEPALQGLDQALR
ncbi:MAG: putative chorismate mutase [Verrucomicrobiaceae bacterium]|nr:putative chorismate mutase [Verrucomicrobiaceae bacterium]